MSSVLKQTVNKAATSTALVSTPNPSTVGQAVKFTATVKASSFAPVLLALGVGVFATNVIVLDQNEPVRILPVFADEGAANCRAPAASYTDLAAGGSCLGQVACSSGRMFNSNPDRASEAK
jgi:hypothetical protein